MPRKLWKRVWQAAMAELPSKNNAVDRKRAFPGSIRGRVSTSVDDETTVCSPPRNTSDRHVANFNN